MGKFNEQDGRRAKGLTTQSDKRKSEDQQTL